MNRGITRALTFALERWIQKGVPHQLLLMTALVVGVAVVGGLAAWVTTPKFASPPEAIWWAFLRLTDPGYLGDDEGLVLRVISTLVTVLGYVLFMGSLIAIMTQWLARTMRRLESGLTPISMKDHVVILGWTNRTPEIVAKLLGAQGRLQRFLDARNTAILRVVVLASEVDVERRLEMRDYLGALWNDNQIFLRSGSSLHPEHLERLDLCRASVVMIPGADFEMGGAELTDARVVKTLLTMGKLFRDIPVEQRPHVISEIFDSRKLALARGTLHHKIEVITSERVISRLVSQSVQHRGLAQILFGILSHREGNSLYLRSFPEFAGQAPRALRDCFPQAVVLGLVRRDADGGLVTILDPESSEALQADDLLVLLAESYAHCQPGDAPPRPRESVAARSGPARRGAPNQRVLVLGWSYKVAGLVAELDQAGAGRFDVTVMSRIDVAQREAELAHVDYSGERVRVENLCADYTIEGEMVRVDPQGFDHVLFMASGLMDTAEEADARTVLGYALLRLLLRNKSDVPEVLVELLDPSNAHLFEDTDLGAVLVSPRVLSHVLAHVALRPELGAVFDELFGSGGTEFDLRAAEDFDLLGRTVTFPEIAEAASQRGVVALGIDTRSGAKRAVHLNPDRARPWTLAAGDQLVVLSVVHPTP